jgi:signal transduction histidine kinase
MFRSVSSAFQLESRKILQHRRVTLELSKDELKYVHPSENQRDGESNDVDGNPCSNSNLPLYEKCAEQHHSNSEETITEEDKLSNLIQTGRHLAHELNNLLTTILANTQLVSLIAKDEDLKSYLGAVEDATRDAELLVRDFQGAIRAIAVPSSHTR